MLDVGVLMTMDMDNLLDFYVSTRRTARAGLFVETADGAENHRRRGSRSDFDPFGTRRIDVGATGFTARKTRCRGIKVRDTHYFNSLCGLCEAA
jgi:hypothetical protein